MNIETEHIIVFFEKSGIITDAVFSSGLLTFNIELLIICHNRLGKFLNSNVFEEMRHLW